jgi:hypothetical protein
MEREKEGGKFYIVKESFDFLNGLENKYVQTTCGIDILR